MPTERIVERLDAHRCRELRLHLRDGLLDRGRDGDGVRARLALNGEHDRARAVEPARHLAVLHAIDHLTDVLQAHRRAVAVGDHHGRERLGGQELAVRIDDVGLVRAPEGARGQVHVAAGDGADDLVDADLPQCERLRIELDAHRVLLRAVDLHLRDARHHRDALREERLAEFIELLQREGGGAEREVQDGRGCRVHLLVRRRDHPLRELTQRLRDRRLHILRGRVDVAVERELQRDRRDPLAAGRRHLIDAGDGRELLLERRRHGGRHRLGARAGERGAHRDRRVVDGGQVAHRELLVRDEAEQKDAGHDEGRHDRTPDEERGDAHAEFTPSRTRRTRRPLLRP